MSSRPPYEAWLPCWGFTETTEEPGGRKALELMYLLQPQWPVFVHIDDGDDRPFTLVYDPNQSTVWFRSGHATYLDQAPFHLGFQQGPVMLDHSYEIYESYQKWPDERGRDP